MALSEWALGSSLDATDASQDVNLDIGVRGISTQTDIILQFACSATSMIDELAVLQRQAILPQRPRCISPASYRHSSLKVFLSVTSTNCVKLSRFRGSANLPAPISFSSQGQTSKVKVKVKCNQNPVCKSVQPSGGFEPESLSWGSIPLDPADSTPILPTLISTDKCNQIQFVITYRSVSTKLHQFLISRFYVLARINTQRHAERQTDRRTDGRTDRPRKYVHHTVYVPCR